MIRRSAAALALLAFTLCAPARPARAEPPPSPPAGAQAVTETGASSAARPAGEAPPGADAPPAAGEVGVQLSAEERRDPGGYRGRPRAVDPLDVALWVPRAIFLPVFAVAELGVRRPVYAVAEWTERHKIVPIIERILEPTPDISWSPVLTLDLNANSMAGAKGKWRNLGVPGHELKASFEIGGEDTWRATARDQWQIGEHVQLGARMDLSQFPNRAYYGLGPRSPNERVNFAHTRYEGLVFESLRADNHLRLELSQGYRADEVGRGWAPSLETLHPLESIPGFTGVELLFAGLDLTVDTRRIPEENGGARVVSNVAFAQDVHVEERRFLTASIDLELAAEVAAPDRVVVLRGYAVETVPLGTEPVPFSYLAMLGWKNHVGFIWGRFRGDTALLAELQYRYPIAYFVDAQWTLSAGNVFGPRFEGLSVGDMTGTIGVGLRTRRAGFGPLEVTFALGTSRFDQPFGFEGLRVYLGTTEGL